MASIPHMTYLRSGVMPTSSEQHFLRVQITAIDADVTNLEREIARLQANLNELILEQEQKKELLVSYRSLLAPIRRIPLEILRSIFLLCCPGFDDDRFGALPLEAPILLTQVCSFWRNISCQTPELWTLITADTVYCPDPYPKHTYLTDFWLPRSGTLPLTLDLNLAEESEESCRLIDALRPYSHRTKKLCVTFPLGIELLRYPLPILNELILNGSELYPPIDFLLEAPSLTTVAFVEFIHHLTHYTCIPWSQLIEIRLRGSVKNITSFRVLAGCCRLQTLEINIYYDPGVIKSLKIILLSQLTSLILKGGVRIRSLDTDNSPFLYILDTPNLRELQVESTDVPTSAILSLVSRSSCLLQHIKVDIYITSHSEAEAMEMRRVFAQQQLTLIESVPSLRKLDVFYDEDRCTSTMADSRLAERASLATKGTT